jgi:hypothetical protein
MRYVPLAILCGCIASQHDPSQYGVLHIRLDPAFDATLQQYAREEARALEALGPDVIVEQDHNTPLPPCTATDCTVVIQSGNSGNCYEAIEIADPVRHVAVLDSECANGEFLWKHVFAHAVMHASGIATHACLSGPQPAADRCDSECIARFEEWPLLAPGVYIGPAGEDLTRVDGSQSIQAQPADLCLWRRYHR